MISVARSIIYSQRTLFTPRKLFLTRPLRDLPARRVYVLFMKYLPDPYDFSDVMVG